MASFTVTSLMDRLRSMPRNITSLIPSSPSSQSILNREVQSSLSILYDHVRPSSSSSSSSTDAALSSSSSSSTPLSSSSSSTTNWSLLPWLKEISGESEAAVCGRVFKDGDIAYNCRNCQADGTCVMCQDCFRNSNHKGHDVSYHRTSAGGCCDCGDVEAWAIDGMCTKHQPSSSPSLASSPTETNDDPAAILPSDVRERLQTVCEVAVGIIVETYTSVAQSYQLKSCTNTVKYPSLPSNDDTNYTIVIHNDDIHTYQDVTNAFVQIAQMRYSDAKKLTENVDSQGESVFKTGKAPELNKLLGPLLATTLHYSIESFELQWRQTLSQGLVKFLQDIALTSDAGARVIVDAFLSPRSSVRMPTFGTLLDIAAPLDDALSSVSSAVPLSRSLPSTSPSLGPVSSKPPPVPRTPTDLSTVSFTIPPIFTTAYSANHSLPSSSSPPSSSSSSSSLLPPAPNDEPPHVRWQGTPEEALLRPGSVDPHGHGPLVLINLIRYDSHQRKALRSGLHDLYIRLMRHTIFRSNLGLAFVTAFPEAQFRWAKGLGTKANLVFDIGVQLLTVPSIVTSLVELGELPVTLIAALYRTLSIVTTAPRIPRTLHTDKGLLLLTAADSHDPIGFAPLVNIRSSTVIHSKYYSVLHLIDLAARIPGFAHAVLRDPACLLGIFHALRLLQGMDGQKRKMGSHVEYENDDWSTAFTVDLRMGGSLTSLISGATLMTGIFSGMSQDLHHNPNHGTTGGSNGGTPLMTLGSPSALTPKLASLSRTSTSATTPNASDRLTTMGSPGTGRGPASSPTLTATGIASTLPTLKPLGIHEVAYVLARSAGSIADWIFSSDLQAPGVFTVLQRPRRTIEHREDGNDDPNTKDNENASSLRTTTDERMSMVRLFGRTSSPTGKRQPSSSSFSSSLSFSPRGSTHENGASSNDTPSASSSIPSTVLHSHPGTSLAEEALHELATESSYLGTYGPCYDVRFSVPTGPTSFHGPLHRIVSDIVTHLTKVSVAEVEVCVDDETFLPNDGSTPYAYLQQIAPSLIVDQYLSSVPSQALDVFAIPGIVAPPYLQHQHPNGSTSTLSSPVHLPSMGLDEPALSSSSSSTVGTRTVTLARDRSKATVHSPSYKPSTTTPLSPHPEDDTLTKSTTAANNEDEAPAGLPAISALSSWSSSSTATNNSTNNASSGSSIFAAIMNSSLGILSSALNNVTSLNNPVTSSTTTTTTSAASSSSFSFPYPSTDTTTKPKPLSSAPPSPPLNPLTRPMLPARLRSAVNVTEKPVGFSPSTIPSAARYFVSIDTPALLGTSDALISHRVSRLRMHTSRHCPVHARAYGTSIDQLMDTAHNTSAASLLSRLQALDTLYERTDPLLALSILEIPLRALTLYVQASCNLWVRNGASIASQVYNYGNTINTSLCFIDPDIRMIQIGLRLLSPQTGLQTILHRFDLRRWYERRIANVPMTKEDELTDDGVRSPGDLTNKERQTIVPEFLRMLIILVTELPVLATGFVAPYDVPFETIEGHFASTAHQYGANLPSHLEQKMTHDLVSSVSSRRTVHSSVHASPTLYSLSGTVSSSMSGTNTSLLPSSFNLGTSLSTVTSLNNTNGTMNNGNVSLGNPPSHTAKRTRSYSEVAGSPAVRPLASPRSGGVHGAPAPSSPTLHVNVTHTLSSSSSSSSSMHDHHTLNSFALGPSAVPEHNTTLLGSTGSLPNNHPSSFPPPMSLAIPTVNLATSLNAKVTVVRGPTELNYDSDLLNLRRELVHTLAWGPKPRSAITKAASIIYERMNKVDENAVSLVLGQIADYRPPVNMESGMYVLKDDVLINEYDPYFIHLPSRRHAEAREVWINKRKSVPVRTANASSVPSTVPIPATSLSIDTARPLAPCPPPTLPAFISVRRILHTVAFAHMVKSTLMDCEGKMQDRTSDANILAMLHLLTIALHTWPIGVSAAAASIASSSSTEHTPMDTNDSSVIPSSTTTVSTPVAPLSIADVFAECLCAETLVLPYGGPTLSTSSSPSSSTHIPSTSPSLSGMDYSSSAGLPSLGHGGIRTTIPYLSGPSVVELLYRLSKMETLADEVREGALWCLNKLRTVHTVTSSMVQTVMGPDLEAAAAEARAKAELARKAELERRKKEAQAQAMAKFTSKQSALLAQFGNDDDDDENEEDIYGNAVRKDTALTTDDLMTGEGNGGERTTVDGRTTTVSKEEQIYQQLLGSKELLATVTKESFVRTPSLSTLVKTMVTPSEVPRCILCGEEDAAKPTAYIALADAGKVPYYASHRAHDLRVQRGKVYGWINAGRPDGKDTQTVSSSSSTTATATSALNAEDLRVPFFTKPTYSSSISSSSSSQASYLYIPYTTDMGVSLTFCGHTVHTDCIHGYLRTSANRRNEMNSHLRNDIGEFSCPLCRTLSNILIPHEANSWPLLKHLTHFAIPPSSSPYPNSTDIVISSTTPSTESKDEQYGPLTSLSYTPTDYEFLQRCGLLVNVNHQLLPPSLVKEITLPTAETRTMNGTLTTVKQRKQVEEARQTIGMHALMGIARLSGYVPIMAEANDRPNPANLFPELKHSSLSASSGFAASTSSGSSSSTGPSASLSSSKPTLWQRGTAHISRMFSHIATRSLVTPFMNERGNSRLRDTPSERLVSLLSAVSYSLRLTDTLINESMHDNHGSGKSDKDTNTEMNMSTSSSSLSTVPQYSIVRHRTAGSALVGLLRHSDLLVHPILSRYPPINETQLNKLRDIVSKYNTETTMANESGSSTSNPKIPSSEPIVTVNQPTVTRTSLLPSSSSSLGTLSTTATAFGNRTTTGTLSSSSTRLPEPASSANLFELANNGESGGVDDTEFSSINLLPSLSTENLPITENIHPTDISPTNIPMHNGTDDDDEEDVEDDDDDDHGEGIEGGLYHDDDEYSFDDEEEDDSSNHRLRYANPSLGLMMDEDDEEDDDDEEEEDDDDDGSSDNDDEEERKEAENNGRPSTTIPSLTANVPIPSSSIPPPLPPTGTAPSTTTTTTSTTSISTDQPSPSIHPDVSDAAFEAFLDSIPQEANGTETNTETENADDEDANDIYDADDNDNEEDEGNQSQPGDNILPLQDFMEQMAVLVEGNPEMTENTEMRSVLASLMNLIQQQQQQQQGTITGNATNTVTNRLGNLLLNINAHRTTQNANTLLPPSPGVDDSFFSPSGITGTMNSHIRRPPRSSTDNDTIHPSSSLSSDPHDTITAITYEPLIHHPVRRVLGSLCTKGKIRVRKNGIPPIHEATVTSSTLSPYHIINPDIASFLIEGTSATSVTPFVGIPNRFRSLYPFVLEGKTTIYNPHDVYGDYRGAMRYFDTLSSSVSSSSSSSSTASSSTVPTVPEIILHLHQINPSHLLLLACTVTPSPVHVLHYACLFYGLSLGQAILAVVMELERYEKYTTVEQFTLTDRTVQTYLQETIESMVYPYVRFTTRLLSFLQPSASSEPSTTATTTNLDVGSAHGTSSTSTAHTSATTTLSTSNTGGSSSSSSTHNSLEDITRTSKLAMAFLHFIEQLPTVVSTRSPSATSESSSESSLTDWYRLTNLVFTSSSLSAHTIVPLSVYQDYIQFGCTAVALSAVTIGTTVLRNDPHPSETISLSSYTLPVSLIDLPFSYDELFGSLCNAVCAHCKQRPTEPALCLICGEVLCAGSSCCRSLNGYHNSSALLDATHGQGECTYHSYQCNGGNGIFLLIGSSAILTIRNSFSAWIGSPYVDHHGETDIGLRRGKPLTLSQRRYTAIKETWCKGGIGREVTRVRSTSDRVVIPNHF